MAYLGLVPSEHSSGASVRRGGITKAGNVLARRVLIEGAWTYRMPARVSRKLHDRNEKLSPAIRDIAWRGQIRLCSRYRRLATAGKPKVVVTRPRDGRLYLGHRPHRPADSRADQTRRQSTRGGRQREIHWCALPATGPRWGTLLPVMSRSPDRRSSLERGSPETKPRSCGNQSAHESLFNRRLWVLSPAVRSSEPAPSVAAEK